MTDLFSRILELVETTRFANLMISVLMNAFCRYVTMSADIASKSEAKWQKLLCLVRIKMRKCNQPISILLHSTSFPLDRQLRFHGRHNGGSQPLVRRPLRQGLHVVVHDDMREHHLIADLKSVSMAFVLDHHWSQR